MDGWVTVAILGFWNGQRAMGLFDGIACLMYLFCTFFFRVRILSRSLLYIVDTTRALLQLWLGKFQACVSVSVFGGSKPTKQTKFLEKKVIEVLVHCPSS